MPISYIRIYASTQVNYASTNTQFNIINFLKSDTYHVSVVVIIILVVPNIIATVTIIKGVVEAITY